jgi:hypothetical protein
MGRGKANVHARFIGVVAASGLPAWRCGGLRWDCAVGSALIGLGLLWLITI